MSFSNLLDILIQNKEVKATKFMSEGLFRTIPWHEIVPEFSFQYRYCVLKFSFKISVLVHIIPLESDPVKHGDASNHFESIRTKHY